MGTFNRYEDNGNVVKSQEYWIRRSEWVEKNAMKDVDKINKTIQNGYTQVLEDIERDITDFLGKYQTMADINKPVTIKQYQTEMNRLWERYNRFKGDDTLSEGARSRAITRINEMNARYRRTRLEVLKEHVKARLDLQGIQSHETMLEGLGEIFEGTFDRKTYTLARGLGYGWQYTSPPWKEIEKAILYPWAEDGSMFSDRIWEMTDKQSEAFIKEVRRTIASDMLAQGKHPSTVAKNIVGFGNPKLSKQQIQKNASRLLYTEATHIIEEASVEASKEWGLTHYVYLATLDKRTSSVCQGLDGTRHAFKDRQAGTNFAPMHPLCRSTHYDDIPNNLYGSRASRSPNGETVHEVPHYAKYSQWKHWQETGKKTWRKPRRKSYANTSTEKPNTQKARPTVNSDESKTKNIKTIMDNHVGIKGITKDMKKELMKYAEKFNERTSLVYAKLSKHFKNNSYNINAKTKGAHYTPSGNKVNMGMKKNIWEQLIGSSDTGAWGTKFHEEFHQLDHLLGKTPLADVKKGSSTSYVRSFTDVATVNGSRMIKAIDDDVLNYYNDLVDRNNANADILGLPKLRTLTDLKDLAPSEASAFTQSLRQAYPTDKDRSYISMFTDAMGLTTENRISPHANGFWGHDASYNRDRGKRGATSETWATFGQLKLRGDTENISVMEKLMPNTLKVYNEIFEEVVEYTKHNDLDYK